jgi:hypothetical protein
MFTQAATAFEPNPVATLQGKPPFHFTVEPELLPGMSMDPVSGEIGGMCDGEGAVDVVVTVENEFGSAKFGLQIKVIQAAYESGLHTKVRMATSPLCSRLEKDGWVEIE